MDSSQKAPMSIDIMSDFLEKDEGVVYRNQQNAYPLKQKGEIQKAANDTAAKEEQEKAEGKLVLEEAGPATYNKDAGIWHAKFNSEFKSSPTVKLLVYGVQKNQVMIRLANLEDNFDGMSSTKSYKFDVNAWAREYYLEANMHMLQKNTTSQILRGIRLNITEMNLAGSVPKSMFNSSLPV